MPGAYATIGCGIQSQSRFVSSPLRLAFYYKEKSSFRTALLSFVLRVLKIEDSRASVLNRFCLRGFLMSFLILKKLLTVELQDLKL